MLQYITDYLLTNIRSNVAEFICSSWNKNLDYFFREKKTFFQNHTCQELQSHNFRIFAAGFQTIITVVYFFHIYNVNLNVNFIQGSVLNTVVNHNNKKLPPLFFFFLEWRYTQKIIYIEMFQRWAVKKINVAYYYKV